MVRLIGFRPEIINRRREINFAKIEFRQSGLRKFQDLRIPSRNARRTLSPCLEFDQVSFIADNDGISINDECSFAEIADILHHIGNRNVGEFQRNLRSAFRDRSFGIVEDKILRTGIRGGGFSPKVFDDCGE